MPSSQPHPAHGAARPGGLLSPLWRIVLYLRRAIRAGAYPLRGIVYFAAHPPFYPYLISRLVPLAIISFIVYFILFTFAFLPQFLFLLIFQGRAGALINTTVLVLGEGLVVIQGLFEGFFVDECRVDIFDATLIDLGYIDLIAPHRVLFPDAPTSPKMLGKPTTRAEYNPWSLTQIVELIVCLPLNLVPYVGTPAFIMITGSRLGQLSHHRWFKLRGLGKKDMKKELKMRRWEYLWFGTVAMLLELCPILSLFFLLTSATGSAMWAAKLEERARAGVGRPIAAHEQTVDNGQDEPAYHDDPV